MKREWRGLHVNRSHCADPPHVRRIGRSAGSAGRLRHRGEHAVRVGAAGVRRRERRRREHRMDALPRQLRRSLRAAVPRAGRRVEVRRIGQHRRRVVRSRRGARLLARTLHPPVAGQRRPPELPHEARRGHEARRRPVRANQLGRGARHHRQRVQAHHREIRQRERVHPGMLGRRAEHHDEQPVLPPVQSAGRRGHPLRQLLERRHQLRRRAVHLRQVVGQPLAQDHPGRRAGGDVRLRAQRHAHGRRRPGLRPQRDARDEERPRHRHRSAPQRDVHEPRSRVDPHRAGHRRRARGGHRARVDHEGPRGPRLPAHVLHGLRRGEHARGGTRQEPVVPRLHHGHRL